MVRHDSDLARSRNGPGLDVKSKLQDAGEGEVSVASEREGLCPLGQDADASCAGSFGPEIWFPVIINDNHARILRDIQYLIMCISRAEPQTSVARS